MTEYKMKIVGCKTCINDVNDFITKVNKFAEQNNIEIQLFDASLIFGKPHLDSAFAHALRSFRRKETATRSLGMELLFYASGERQITRAIKKMGVKKGESSIIVCLLYPLEFNHDIDKIVKEFIQCFDLNQVDSVTQPDKSMLSTFGISKKAQSSVKKDQIYQLVLEKIALVDIIK